MIQYFIEMLQLPLRLSLTLVSQIKQLCLLHLTELIYTLLYSLVLQQRNILLFAVTVCLHSLVRILDLVVFFPQLPHSLAESTEDALMHTLFPWRLKNTYRFQENGDR